MLKIFCRAEKRNCNCKNWPAIIQPNSLFARVRMITWNVIRFYPLEKLFYTRLNKHSWMNFRLSIAAPLFSILINHICWFHSQNDFPLRVIRFILFLSMLNGFKCSGIFNTILFVYSCVCACVRDFFDFFLNQ